MTASPKEGVPKPNTLKKSEGFLLCPPYPMGAAQEMELRVEDTGCGGHRGASSPFWSSTFPTVKWGSIFPKTELTHGELTTDSLTRKTTRIRAGAAGQACGGLEAPGDKLLTPITFLPHTRNTENLEQKSRSRRNMEILSRLFCRQGN